tara:strand:+ start:46 stop:354 length:309 start_codon:yes stop_codon:yes gene_type:complete
MEPNQFSSLQNAIKVLADRGFTESIICDENGARFANDDALIEPSQIRIVDYHRVEADSDADDRCMVYALESESGRKGVLVNSPGMYSDTNINAFLKQLETPS